MELSGTLIVQASCVSLCIIQKLIKYQDFLRDEDDEISCVV